MIQEELKKQIRAIDLAVSAGKKRQSPRTGFVHLLDTIPLYENFCFAFALFRQKTAESVGEGKALLERLLAFQVEQNFPIYLHDYPQCFDLNMGLKIAPILTYLLRLFAPVLGSLSAKVEKALAEVLKKRPEKPFWENRYRALKGEPLLETEKLDWVEWLITEQLAGRNHFKLPYDEALQLFLPQVQEKGEPRPNAIEYLLAEPNFSSRLLRDHKEQLLVAPLFPFSYEKMDVEMGGVNLFWQGSLGVHSLYAKALEFNLEGAADTSRNNLFEASFFCNASMEAKIFVEGKKATSFALGDRITIETPEKSFEVRFELKEGTGDFFGHIFKANRPTEKGVEGYEAYDWQIGLRTLRRSEKVKLQLHIEPWLY
jgi:hypothetical protein